MNVLKQVWILNKWLRIFNAFWQVLYTVLFVDNAILPTVYRVQNIYTPCLLPRYLSNVFFLNYVLSICYIYYNGQNSSLNRLFVFISIALVSSWYHFSYGNNFNNCFMLYAHSGFCVKTVVLNACLHDHL